MTLDLKLNFPLVWETWEVGPIKVRRGYLKIHGLIPLVSNFLGFDPGEVNMGIARLFPPEDGELWQIKFPSNSTSVERIYNTESIMDAFLNSFTDPVVYAVVENAAFGSPYGQAALSENRTMIAHNVIERGIEIAFVPPLSVRKRVFGSGKTKAEDTWPELAYKGHNDIASALACALYGYSIMGDVICIT